MTRPVKSVHDMAIDEVSLVDRPANQHAAVMIAKNYQGEAVADEVEEIQVFDAAGVPIPEDAELEDGTTVYGEDGQAYRWNADDDAQAEAAGELVGAGGVQKNAGEAFRPGAGREVVGKSLADTFREELSKATNGTQVQAVIEKMAGALSVADQRAVQAEQIAKSERDIRLDREYIAKAAEYNVPIAAGELGPVLKRMAENMSFEDCVVIDKALNSAGNMLFTELGFTGGGTEDGTDPMAQAEAAAAERIAKSAGTDHTISKAEAVESFYADNPAAYDDYLANRG
jgi:hypothetical protein